MSDPALSTPPADLFSVAGKTVVVTGGTRGIGHMIAAGFVAAGATVIVASRKAHAVQATVAELSDFGACSGFAADLSSEEGARQLADAVSAHHGRVDVLVNNAGMSLPYGDLGEVTEAMWDKVVGLNLKGPFRLTALVGPRMVEDGGGSIINVSSTGSIRPAPFMLPYDAAKAGLNALTVGFAHAYGPTVRANCIMAGPFFTDVTKEWDLESFEREVQLRHALQRGGRPDEIVGTALYFASNASSYTTGAVLRVDGGIP